MEDRFELADRIAKEYGILPSVLLRFASGNEESMRELAEAIKWEKQKAGEDAVDEAVREATEFADKAERESKQNEPGDAETLAEREKREILGEEHYLPTQEEVDAFTMEQHVRWVEAGGRVRPESESPEEIEAKREADEARAAEMERLEKMPMSQYAKEVNAREEA
jgi:hypothetical protein